MWAHRCCQHTRQTLQLYDPPQQANGRSCQLGAWRFAFSGMWGQTMYPPGSGKRVPQGSRQVREGWAKAGGKTHRPTQTLTKEEGRDMERACIMRANGSCLQTVHMASLQTLHILPLPPPETTRSTLAPEHTCNEGQLVKHVTSHVRSWKCLLTR